LTLTKNAKLGQKGVRKVSRDLFFNFRSLLSWERLKLETSNLERILITRSH